MEILKPTTFCWIKTWSLRLQILVWRECARTMNGKCLHVLKERGEKYFARFGFINSRRFFGKLLNLSDFSRRCFETFSGTQGLCGTRICTAWSAHSESGRLQLWDHSSGARVWPGKYEPKTSCGAAIPSRMGKATLTSAFLACTLYHVTHLYWF